jgi:hypothetical protein
MGLIVSVYTNAGSGSDHSMNGVTNRFNRLCVINVDGPFDPSDDCPAVLLEQGALDGTAVLRPVEAGDNWTMFGGNFAATSDSRFHYAIENITGNRFYGAIPVHDRIE